MIETSLQKYCEKKEVEKKENSKSKSMPPLPQSFTVYWMNSFDFRIPNFVNWKVNRERIRNISRKVAQLLA